MQIYDKRLDEIKPYENNPRHNDNAVDAVANSIREFGFKVPIVEILTALSSQVIQDIRRRKS